MIRRPLSILLLLPPALACLPALITVWITGVISGSPTLEVSRDGQGTSAWWALLFGYVALLVLHAAIGLFIMKRVTTRFQNRRAQVLASTGLASLALTVAYLGAHHSDPTPWYEYLGAFGVFWVPFFVLGISTAWLLGDPRRAA